MESRDAVPAGPWAFVAASPVGSVAGRAGLRWNNGQVPWKNKTDSSSDTLRNRAPFHHKNGVREHLDRPRSAVDGRDQGLYPAREPQLPHKSRNIQPGCSGGIHSPKRQLRLHRLPLRYVGEVPPSRWNNDHGDRDHGSGRHLRVRAVGGRSCRCSDGTQQRRRWRGFHPSSRVWRTRRACGSSSREHPRPRQGRPACPR